MSPEVTTLDLDRFRGVVARRLGLHLDDSKTAFLEEVLRRRLASVSRSTSAYLADLETEATKELRELARELTVGETYFFRNNDQFRALAEVVLPERIHARGADRRLRLLSAGCSSGEEAYSLSIVAQQVLAPSWDLAVLAVDVNPSALEKARRPRFSQWALRETPSELERRWFRAQDRESLLDDAARAPVRFEERNLIERDPRLWSPATYDVVFCRNVLMYFTPEKAQSVIESIARSLVPGGYLFLGHAETLRGMSNAFHLRHTHETFYYQRRESLELPAAQSVIPLPPPREAACEGEQSWIDVIRRASERIDALTSARPPSSPSRAQQAPDLGAALQLLQREQYGEALDWVGALPTGGTTGPDVLLLRAVLLTHRGRLQEAEETCRQLLEQDDLNAGAHYVLALCREDAGDLRGALERNQVAVYLDPSFAMARLHLGLVARKRADLETARRELAHALLLLRREDSARLLLFGGGFGREALIALCSAELAVCGGAR